MDQVASIYEYIRNTSSRIFKYFGVLVIFVASFHFGLDYITHPASWDYLIDKAFILSGFAVLLTGAIFSEITGNRKERYANVFDRLAEIETRIKCLNVFLAAADPDRSPIDVSTREYVNSVLDSVASMYSMITGTTCRASIKAIVFDGDKSFVYTYCRDSASTMSNKARDLRRLEQRSDPLDGNEDFEAIFNEDAAFYFENDLTTKEGYRNTSLQHPLQSKSQWKIVRAITARQKWKLPYRSTMVFPIQQREVSSLNPTVAGCVGFLTIDSPFRNAFDRRFDAPLGVAVANTLFLPMWLSASMNS